MVQIVSRSSANQKQEHILFLQQISFKPNPNIPDGLEVLDQIKKEFPDVDVTVLKASNSKDVPEELWEKATIIVSLFVFPDRIEDIPNVHLVHLISAGSDHLASNPLITSPKAKHINITTSSGIHGPPIAEWALMSTLALTRHYNQMHNWQKERHWGPKTLWLTTSGDWVGKTVGILGYGSIGRHIARLFSALGANIHAYTHTPRDTPESRKDHGYVIPNTGDPEGTIPKQYFSSTREGLSTFLKSNLHALVISTPLTKETTNLLGSKEFADLQSTSPWPPNPLSPSPTSEEDENNPKKEEEKKPGALIINISRGKIINQPDLIVALKEKDIVGAALDVTDPEPLEPENELWSMKNVVIAPHISGLGSEYLGRALDVLRVNLGRLRNGEELINVVKRGRGY